MALQKPKFLRDEPIFRGAWGKGMIKRVFRDPRTGGEESYYLFHSRRVPAIVLPMTTDDRVVAVRIFCQAVNALVLQLPGGVPQVLESFEDAARREVLEETGYRVGSLTPMGKGWFEPFNTTTSFQTFLALGCEEVEVTTENPTEYLQVETYPWETWWEMCLTGEIEDAKSVLVTTRALEAMRKRA